MPMSASWKYTSTKMNEDAGQYGMGQTCRSLGRDPLTISSAASLVSDALLFVRLGGWLEGL